MVAWVLYQALILLAAGATGAYLLVRRAIAPGATTATALWAYLALQGSNIVLYHQDGTSTTIAAPYWQYVAAFLALISFTAFVLWIFGVYPPEDEDQAVAASDRGAGESSRGQTVPEEF